MKSLRVFACGLLALSFVAGAAEAAGPEPDKAAAQALFDQARELMNAGNYTAACPKLEASQQLSHGTGTLLNLADCYDKLGKTASAWRTFHKAADSARAAGQEERARLAELRASVLEARLMRVRVVVPQPPPPDLHVFRDVEELTAESWNKPLPLDPGRYTVRAERGARTWSQQIELSEAGATLDVAIPSLEQAPAAEALAPPAVTPPAASAAPPAGPVPPPGASPAAAAQPPADTPAPAPPGPNRTLAYVLGGAGLVGVGVSAVFAVKAKSQYDTSLEHCRTRDLCSRRGLDERDDAQFFGNVATAALVVGVAGLAIGGYLFLSEDPKPKQASSLTLSPALAPRQAGLMLQGAY
jgi:serine/threonine-protein kinase